RSRWVAAGVSLAVLFALVGVFFGIRVGLSSSESLAKSGPAYETLQTLERGGVTTGSLTPIEVLVQADQAKPVADALGQVDGIERALVSRDESTTRDAPSGGELNPG